ncbi:hypothetical protein PSTT_06574 [Puccinia striiformis]|uniref:CxC1-like cysteine cluster associated with KDZ transposases domain-containing protein n=1 Tax=Puccinia striiformis TaxID=27350 RepID=A0A2S4VJN8_9BASI|nr:hypothetical protein PSTT_06574 [Puccinia striiformis]
MARINVENPVANRARHTTSRPALTMGKIRMKIPVVIPPLDGETFVKEQTDTFNNVEEFNPLPGLKDDKEDDSDDKCGEWVTLVEEEPDIIDIMKLLTKNWTWVNWNKKFNTRCNCPTRVKTSRMIDLVDLHTQHRIRVEFCGCTPDAIWLLRRGYLAGSPVVPQTAFSLPLLIFHNGWLHAENRKHARDMCRPFTAAVDMYRQLERIFESVVFSALGLQPQQILANLTCPACFGPQPLNTSPYPETTRNRLCVCLDANFQQCHHIKASRNHKRLQTPRIFLAQEEVDQTTEMIQKEEMEDNTPEKVMIPSSLRSHLQNPIITRRRTQSDNTKMPYRTTNNPSPLIPSVPGVLDIVKGTLLRPETDAKLGARPAEHQKGYYPEEYATDWDFLSEQAVRQSSSLCRPTY